MRSAKDAALEYFARRFNCAEAVLLGLAEVLGIEETCIPRIATGFGAGIGFRGDVCGAVSGAVMGLSLIFGRERAEDQDAKLACYGKVRQVIEAFEAKFGSIKCLDLTKCDMRTPEGRARADELDLHSKVCPAFVAFAAETAQGLIEG